MDPNNSLPLEHQAVPQAHRGLHDFLYSAEDEHAVSTTATVQESTENEPLEDWCVAAGETKVAGVYAVLDGDRHTQYIGYSRNVALSLKSHQTQLGSTTCAFVKVQPFKFPKREDMEQLRDSWIAALPNIPPGNVESGAWAGTVKDAAVLTMSASEREAYEAKKLKLRRAMADGTLHQESPPSQTEVERRQWLEASVEGDNWSAVVQEQTQETQV